MADESKRPRDPKQIEADGSAAGEVDDPYLTLPRSGSSTDGPVDRDHVKTIGESLDVDADSAPETDPSTLDLQRTAEERTTSFGVPTELLARTPRGMPARVAGYELLEEIARGGMGVVYKARQVSLHRTVALKMILSGSHASDEEVQRFFSEAQAAARLTHPAIVPIYEVGQWEESPYFSMEYVEGPTLAEMIRDRPLNPRLAAEYLSQVADGIEYAHRAGILHRDLKPGNVLVNKQGQVKVTDFGLAKQVESESEITASGAVLGTPSFMPPEQALASRERIGPASDVYSLGAMLYAVLIGRAPFQAASTAQTLLQVINNPPVSLRELDPTIPRDLETICAKCLEKEPVARYASAAELSSDLQRFLAGEPIRARRANTWERTVRWCRRNPIGAALIAALGVAVLVSLLAVTFVTRSLRLERLASLQTSFAVKLDKPALGKAYVRELDQLRSQVAEISVDEANRMESRYKQEYADYLRRQIEQPRLENETREQIAESLADVRGRIPDPVWGTLEQLLTSSTSRWQAVTEMRPPYENFAAIFSETSVSRSNDKLFVLPRNNRRNAFVPTKIETRGDVMIEVEFSESWRTRRYVGFAVDCVLDDRKSLPTFELLVHSPQKVLSEPLDGLPMMGESSDSELQIDVRRQGYWLGHARVPKPDNGVLRLVFRREGRQLQLQLNQHAPLNVEELFPLVVAADNLRLELIDLPAIEQKGTPLAVSSLKVMRRQLPSEPHPLESGDLSFSQGEFVTALEQYQSRSPEWSNELQLEAKYKAALALIQLQRGSEAELRLAELAGQEISIWRFRAYAQLWVLALQDNDLQEAELISTEMLAEDSFEELVVQLPRSSINKLLNHYGSELYTDMDNHALPPERLAELERAVVIVERLGAPLDTVIGMRWDLATAYLWADQSKAAIETVRHALDELPQNNYTKSIMLELYARALRADGVPLADQITEIERFLFDVNGEILPDGLSHLDVLIRTYLAEDDGRRALQLLEREDFRARQQQLLSSKSHYHLMLGLAQKEVGRVEEARSTWKEGLRLIRQSEGALDRSTVDAFALLAGLAEDVTSEDIPRMLSAMSVDQLGGRVIENLRIQFVSDAEIASIIRHLHRGSNGEKYIDGVYLGRYNGREANFMLGRIIGLEVARQMVGGIEHADSYQFPPDLVIELSEHYNDAQQAAWDHTIGHLQITQIAMAFQGVTGILGWSGLHASLPEKHLPPLGFLLGSHLVNRGRRESGIRILRDAYQLATEGSELKDALAEKLTSLGIAEPIR